MYPNIVRKPKKAIFIIQLIETKINFIVKYQEKPSKTKRKNSIFTKLRADYFVFLRDGPSSEKTYCIKIVSTR